MKRRPGGFHRAESALFRRGVRENDMNDTFIRGARTRELPKPNRTYGEGRVCAHEGCETRISVYNRSEFCWAHTPVRFPLTRGERRRKAAA